MEGETGGGNDVIALGLTSFAAKGLKLLNNGVPDPADIATFFTQADVVVDSCDRNGDTKRSQGLRMQRNGITSRDRLKRLFVLSFGFLKGL